MAGYVALFTTGFKRQARYRGALFTGLLANVFFGIFRSAVFIALYRDGQAVGGVGLAEALTYVWVLQTLFGAVFTPWLWEYPESVRSGDFVMQLLKPGDPFGRHMAADLGRTAFSLLARGLPQILLPGLFLHLALPTTVPGVALLALSFVMTAAAAFEIRFLLGSTAFWTPDFRGWWSLIFGALWFGGGFVVPVQFFPGALRFVGEYGPIAPLLAAPVKVATGDGVLGALLTQLGWIAVLLVACRTVMTVAERRLVVHGG